jgi:hypothetical protein
MICSKCNKEFDDNLIIPKSRKCPICHRKDRLATQNKYYYKNPEKIKAYAKQYRHRNRFIINEKIKKYKQTFIEKSKKQGKDYRKKMKQKVILAYSHDIKCSKCNFSDIRALTIDHINGGGTQHRKKINGSFYKWLEKNNYPKEYQVLCMNCQFIKRDENNECQRT